MDVDVRFVVAAYVLVVSGPFFTNLGNIRSPGTRIGYE